MIFDTTQGIICILFDLRKQINIYFSGILGSNVIHISIFQLNWTQVKQYLPKQTVDISFAVVTWFVIWLSTVFICFMFKLLTTDHLPSKRCGKENESSNLLRRNFPRVKMLFYSEMSIPHQFSYVLAIPISLINWFVIIG